MRSCLAPPLCTLLQLIAPRRRRRPRAALTAPRAAPRAPQSSAFLTPMAGATAGRLLWEWCTGLLHAVWVWHARGGLGDGAELAEHPAQDQLRQRLPGAIMWWLVGHPIAYDGPNGFFGLVPEARGTMAVQYRAQRDDATDADFAAGGEVRLGLLVVPVHLRRGVVHDRVGGGGPSARITSRRLTRGGSRCSSTSSSTWAWCGGGGSIGGQPRRLLNGVIDFAGSGVVHAVGGTAAVLGIAITGPRPRTSRRRRTRGGARPAIHMRGHSHVLQVLGTMGNTGSAGTASDAGSTLSITGSHGVDGGARGVHDAKAASRAAVHGGARAHPREGARRGTCRRCATACSRASSRSPRGARPSPHGKPSPSVRSPRSGMSTPSPAPEAEPAPSSSSPLPPAPASCAPSAARAGTAPPRPRPLSLCVL